MKIPQGQVQKHPRVCTLLIRKMKRFEFGDIKSGGSSRCCALYYKENTDALIRMKRLRHRAQSGMFGFCNPRDENLNFEILNN